MEISMNNNFIKDFSELEPGDIFSMIEDCEIFMKIERVEFKDSKDTLHTRNCVNTYTGELAYFHLGNVICYENAILKVNGE